MRNSPLTLTEIALATGFASSSHFSRAYAAQFGQTPRPTGDGPGNFEISGIENAHFLSRFPRGKRARPRRRPRDCVTGPAVCGRRLSFRGPAP
ncbi:MAG: AraC family transcriptional regulator [Roseovarius indicus]